jgi:hypothetical protein
VFRSGLRNLCCVTQQWVDMPHCSLLKAITVPFLPRAVIVTSLSLSLNVSFLPVVSFPTAISAPSLRPARPERFAGRLPVEPVYHNHPKFLLFHSHSLILTLTFSPVGVITSGVAGAPTYPATLLFSTSFFVSEGADPSTVSSSRFSATLQTIQLLFSRTPVRWISLRPRYCFS